MAKKYVGPLGQAVGAYTQVTWLEHHLDVATGKLNSAVAQLTDDQFVQYVRETEDFARTRAEAEERAEKARLALVGSAVSS